MSKQSEAKQAQGYSPHGPTCGQCQHFQSDFVPFPWMVKRNAERIADGMTPQYDLTLPQHQREANLRCGIGGFAVKKAAYCKRYELAIRVA